MASSNTTYSFTPEYTFGIQTNGLFQNVSFVDEQTLVFPSGSLFYSSYFLTLFSLTHINSLGQSIVVYNMESKEQVLLSSTTNSSSSNNNSTCLGFHYLL